MDNDNSNYLQAAHRPNYDCLLFGKLHMRSMQWLSKKPDHFCFVFSDTTLFHETNHQRGFSWFLLSVSDLDDTLYPLSSGLAVACRKNIGGKQP